MENLIVWIKASFYKHFKDRITNFNIFLEDEEDIADEPIEDKIIIRVNGPDLVKQDSNTYKISVNLNILTATCRDLNKLFRYEEIQGIVLKNMNLPINIYKIGGNFDGSCLTTISNNSGVVITNFGKVDPGKDLYFTTLEADYVTTLRL